MTKKMEQALNDTPIVNAILRHDVNEGESMCWCGVSGVIYQTNTLTALVKRGLLQYDRITEPTPRFILKDENHNKLHWAKENKLWV